MGSDMMRITDIDTHTGIGSVRGREWDFVQKMTLKEPISCQFRQAKKQHIHEGINQW